MRQPRLKQLLPVLGADRLTEPSSPALIAIWRAGQLSALRSRRRSSGRRSARAASSGPRWRAASEQFAES